ncbi:MAG: GFA family protein [Erythrobacter sp.]
MSAEIAPLKDPLNGHCLCGEVSIEINHALPTIDVCHCDMCRRWSGSFFCGMNGAAFTVSGEDTITIYKSSDWAERAFCSKCGSNLWYRFVPGDQHNFLAGLFDLPAGIEIEQQIFVDEKPDWYDLAQKSPMKTGAEVIAEAEAAGFKFD